MSTLKKYAIKIFLAIATLFLFTIFYIAAILPSINLLLENDMQVPMRIFTSDGELIAEYGEKHRLPIKYQQIPPQMVAAIIAAEDHRFFSHFGVDVKGIVRAVKELAITGKKSQGASTITMQVARNFFLSAEKTYSRKINEILLALKIEYFLPKEKILELYLNKIFLGHRAYGVQAAARNYYGKDIKELDLAQFAMLAGLPKAPSSNNPIANPARSLERRNYILRNMLALSLISNAEYEDAVSRPITESLHTIEANIQAPHAAELVRQDMYAVFGSKAYSSGLEIYTTLNSVMQKSAVTSLTNGLFAYDKRHSINKAQLNLSNKVDSWLPRLANISSNKGHIAAAVYKKFSDGYELILASGEVIFLPKEHFIVLYSNPASDNDIVTRFDIGDVVLLELKDNSYVLSRNPEVEGALISVNPKTGAILALNGGYHFKESNFNRVTQARRQLGSLFKPFVYSAALDNGFYLSSVINDAPFVVNDSGADELWRPNNVNFKFAGPTNLRTALTNSRNLVAVRILDSIGLAKTISFVERFGFSGRQELPESLSLALGSGVATPLQVAAAYSVFANKGVLQRPYLIDRIQSVSAGNIAVTGSKYSCNNISEKVITEQNSYLVTSMLRDVITKGTARRAKVLKRSDLAGKTGTTNNKKDAWFAGYNSDVVTVVWVGFDTVKTLGEYGSQLALPIWVDYMRSALSTGENTKNIQPNGIVSARVNPKTGLLTAADTPGSYFELFDISHMPNRDGAAAISNSTSEVDQVEELFY